MNATPMPTAAAATAPVAADCIPRPSACPAAAPARPAAETTPENADAAAEPSRASPDPKPLTRRRATGPPIAPIFSNAPRTCEVTGLIHDATREPSFTNGDASTVACAAMYPATGPNAPRTVEPIARMPLDSPAARRPPTCVARDANARDACRAPFFAIAPRRVSPVRSDVARRIPPMDPARPVKAERAAFASAQPERKFCPICFSPSPDRVVVSASWVAALRAAV